MRRLTLHVGRQLEQGGEGRLRAGAKLQIKVGDHAARYGVVRPGPAEHGACWRAARRRGEAGVGPSEPVCFGAIGFPIAINSETVTNLNPLACS